MIVLTGRVSDEQSRHYTEWTLYKASTRNNNCNSHWAALILGEAKPQSCD